MDDAHRGRDGPADRRDALPGHGPPPGGRAPGSTLQGRFYHLRPDGTRWTGPIVERLGTDGGSFPDFGNSGSIVADERLRFECIYYPPDAGDDAPVTVTSVKVRGLYWER